MYNFLLVLEFQAKLHEIDLFKSQAQILPGVKTFFEDLRAANKNVYFVTNNTSKTRDEYVEKLNSYGVRASKDEVCSHFKQYYLTFEIISCLATVAFKNFYHCLL